MDIKKLQRAAKILGKLKTVDLEIIELDKIAQKALDYPKSCSIELFVEAQEKEDNKRAIDAERHVFDPRNPSGLLQYYMDMQTGKLCGIGGGSHSETASLKKEVSDSIILGVIGVMLSEKHEQRKVLLEQLNKLGINA